MTLYMDCKGRMAKITGSDPSWNFFHKNPNASYTKGQRCCLDQSQNSKSDGGPPGERRARRT